MLTNKALNPAKHDPPVYKVVNGDADPDDTFKFKLEAISTTANCDMPMPEGSRDGVKTIETEAEDLHEFGDIIFRTPGEYYYKISEVNTGLDGYTYDQTEYVLHYTLKVEGTDLVMTRETLKDDEVVKVSQYDFVNVYDNDTPPDKPDTGDYTNVVLPAAIFGGALILLAVLILKRRQRKDNE